MLREKKPLWAGAPGPVLRKVSRRSLERGYAVSIRLVSDGPSPGPTGPRCDLEQRTGLQAPYFPPPCLGSYWGSLETRRRPVPFSPLLGVQPNPQEVVSPRGWSASISRRLMSPPSSPHSTVSPSAVGIHSFGN